MYNHHLDYFILAADLGSFSKAAAKFYISPVAFIKQINALEDEIGIKLFNRTHQGVTLTLAGKSIYADSKVIIDLVNKAVTQANELTINSKKNIRIGNSLLRPSQSLVSIWNEIYSKYPDYQIQIIPIDDDRKKFNQVLQSLDDSIDLFLSVLSPNTNLPNYQKTVLSSIPLRIGVPRSHHLAHKRKIKMTDLKGEILYMVQTGDTAYIDKIRSDLNKNYPEITIQSIPPYDMDVFNRVISAGHLIVTIDLWENAHPSLKILPCEWQYSIPFGIVYSSKASQKVLDFVNIVQKSYSRS